MCTRGWNISLKIEYFIITSKDQQGVFLTFCNWYDEMGNGFWKLNYAVVKINILFNHKIRLQHFAYTSTTSWRLYITRKYVVFTYRSLQMWWHLQKILEVLLVYKLCQVPVYHLLTKSKQQVNIRIQVMNIHI